MAPSAPSPSARFARAVAGERADLRRRRERLLARRDDLRAALDAAEASLRDLDERDALLARLVPEPPSPTAAGAAPDSGARAVAGSSGGEGVGARAAAGSSGGEGVSARVVAAAPGDEGVSARAVAGGRGGAPLRGPAIRRAAVQVLLALPDRPQALHYRAWFEALGAAGFDVLGKDPLAVFLTQLGRSPVVRKGTQSGVYELDPGAPRRLRARLDALHAELRALTVAPTATADLTEIRAQRAALTAQISQVEKALEEAEAVLAGRTGAAGGPVAAAG